MLGKFSVRPCLTVDSACIAAATPCIAVGSDAVAGDCAVISVAQGSLTCLQHPANIYSITSDIHSAGLGTQDLQFALLGYKGLG